MSLAPVLLTKHYNTQRVLNVSLLALVPRQPRRVQLPLLEARGFGVSLEVPNCDLSFALRDVPCVACSDVSCVQESDG